MTIFDHAPVQLVNIHYKPISYFWSIWELYVLDQKTKVFCKKENQLHFPMDKGLTVPK